MRVFTGMILGFLLPLTVCANTQALFSRDGNQATVLLIGMPGDSDPAGFNGALKVPQEDFQGKWSKRLSVPGWDAACLFSKVIEASGTCTLIFKNAAGRSSVDKASGRARLTLTGEDAARFAENFHLPEETNIVFRSRDGKLQASVVKEDGKVTWFVIDWNGRGIF